MRQIMLLLLLAGLASAQIFGPAGIPLSWDFGIISFNADTVKADSLVSSLNGLFSGWVSADSVEADHFTGVNAVLSGPLSADSVEADHWTGVSAVLSGPLSADSIEADHFTGVNAVLSGTVDVAGTIDADSLDLVAGAVIGGDLDVGGDFEAVGQSTFGNLITPDDAGLVAVFDRDVSSAAVLGTAQGIIVRTDTTDIMTVAALADGAGGVTDPYVTVHGDLEVTGAVDADSLDLVGGALIGGSLGVTTTVDADSLDLVGGALIGGDLTVVGAGDDIVVGAYTRRVCLEAGSATLGPTAPSWDETATVGGLGFDADAETVHLRFSVPDDWDAASDMTTTVAWMSQSGDAIEDTETVEWQIEYRSLAWGTDVADAGTAVSDDVTYTQAGAGTDKATFNSTFTIDHDNANQPLTAGDCLVILFNRDVTTDTYSGDGIVLAWTLNYTSVGLAR